MKSRLAFLFTAVAVLLFAPATGAASTPDGQPVGVPVKLWGIGACLDYSTPATLSLSGLCLASSDRPAGNYSLSGSRATKGGFTTTKATVRLEPGKTYFVTVGAEFSPATIAAIAPPGYSIEMDGVSRTQYMMASFDESYAGQLRLRVVGPMERIAGRAGMAGEIAGDRIYWQVALGQLKSGGSAGALALIDAATGSTWSTLFTPAGLSYESVSGDVEVYRVSGAIRQIHAPEASVNVVTDSATKFHLDFYNAAQLQAGSNPRTFTGSPFATYTIERNGSDTALKLTKETRNLPNLTTTGVTPTRTEYTTLVRTGTFPAFTWVRHPWDTSLASPQAETRSVWGGTSADRTAVDRIGDPGTTDVINAVAETATTYHAYNWGEAPTLVKAGGTADAKDKTEYEYYTTAAELGSYGFVRSVTRKDLAGNVLGWEAYEYNAANPDGTNVGTISRRHRPFKDAPAAVPADLAANTSGEITRYAYAADAFGMLTRPTLVETKVNGTITAQSDFSYTDTTANGLNVVQVDRYDWVDADSGHRLHTVTKIYREDTGDAFFRGQVHSVVRPDKVKLVYAYQRGTLSGTTFTSGTSGTASRVVAITGSSVSTAGTALSAYAGYTLDTLYVVDGKSTLEITLRDDHARVTRTETQVWSSGAWNPVTSTDYTYNHANQPTGSTASNHAQTSAGYDGEQADEQTDAAGVRTTYTYDSRGRVLTQVKKGVSSLTAVLTAGYSYPAQGDVTTTLTYDDANRVTQSVVSGGTLSQTSTSVFDLAGRLTSTTAPGGYTTSFAYSFSSGHALVTATLPGTATRTTTTYRDGRTHSVTGNAVVNEFFDYAIDGSGNFLTQHRLASSASPALTTTTTDRLGRTTRQDSPAFTGSSSYTLTNTFNALGQLAKRTQSGLADTLYEYDSLGGLYREGLKISTGTTLSPASSDRITERTWSFFTTGGNWWRREIAATYATTGVDTATQVAKIETQLSGLPAGRVSRTDTTDLFGNVTTAYTEVDRANKKLIATTDVPDSSTNAVQVAYNGRGVEARDPTGVTMRYEHDGLGRQAKAIDPRTGATTTAYVSGTSQVYTVTDPAGVVQATYTYDSAGRVGSVKNALTQYARTSYTPRGEIEHQWGDTAAPVEFTYNAYGQQATMKTYRGGSGWTGASWPAGTTGAADTTTWAYQESTGLLTSKTDTATKAVSYTYTAANQLHVRTWARGVTATYGYSPTTGEQTDINYSDGTPDVTQAYNRLGQLIQITSSDGLVTAFDPCVCGKLLAEVPDATFFGSRRIDYSLHPAADGTKGRTMGYTLKQGATTEQSVSYGYDSVGRCNTLTADGTAFSYAYTANSGFIESITQGGASWTQTRSYLPTRDLLDVIETKIGTRSQGRFDYSHDALGRRTGVAKTGEIFQRYSAGGLDTVWGYNARSELIDEQTKLGGTGTVLTGRDDAPGGSLQGYAYDNQGNRTATTHNAVTATYTPNGLNQYASRAIPGLLDVAGLAPAGAVVTVGGSSAGVARHNDYYFKSVGVANTWQSLTVASSWGGSEIRSALVAPTPETFGHDEDGNLKTDSHWSRTYDAENRLVTMETISTAYAAGAPRQKLEFRYDALGRRIGKKVYHYASGWVLDYERRFLYDGWNLIEELNVAGATLTPLRTFAWGLDHSGSRQGAGGIGGLLKVTDVAGANSYLPLYDGNGNVMGMIKAADGSIAATYEYDAFGRTLRESGPFAANNPIRFSSKYTDGETGEVYYGLRYYSPVLGRFINRDPIGEQGGLNLYGFVGNDGVSRWDYLGMAFDGVIDGEDFLPKDNQDYSAAGTSGGGGSWGEGSAWVEVEGWVEAETHPGTYSPSNSPIDIQLPKLVVTYSLRDNMVDAINRAANGLYGRGTIAGGPTNTFELWRPASTTRGPAPNSATTTTQSGQAVVFVVDGAGANAFDHTGIAVRGPDGKLVYYDVQAESKSNPRSDGSVNKYTLEEFRKTYGDRNPRYTVVDVPDINRLRNALDVTNRLWGAGGYGYDAANRNCTGFVCDALYKGGYEVRMIPGDRGENPWRYPNDLEQSLRYFNAPVNSTGGRN